MKYLEKIGYFEIIKSIEEEIIKEESKAWFLRDKKWLNYLEKLYSKRLNFLEKIVEDGINL